MTLRTAVLVALLASPAAAQPDPFVRPLPPAAAGTETLGKYLRELGFEPKALSPDVYQVTVERDRWPVHVMLSLSTDGRRVWLESKFAPVEDPDKVSPAAWKRLLEANEKIGPAHFAFDRSDRRVHLYKSFDNQGLAPDRLMRELEHFDTTVRKTQDYWRGDNFKPVIGSTDVPPTIPTAAPVKREAPAAPVVREVGEEEKLRGNWEVVEIRVRGRKTPEAILKERRPSLTVDVLSASFGAPDGKPGFGPRLVADVKTGPGPTRHVDLKLGGGLPPKLDLADGPSGSPELGIYKLDGDTLTLCFAAPGEPRPVAFTTGEESKGWVIVLKRSK
jgi:uncharacterized protein (TIGR03067 family)